MSTYWLKENSFVEMTLKCWIIRVVLVLNIGSIYEIYLEPGLTHKTLSDGTNIVFQCSSVRSNGGDSINFFFQRGIENVCTLASEWLNHLCKTLLCILLLDACLGNGKPLSHHKPYTSLHCVFYTESPTESKSSDERGRYRSWKMKGRTDSFTRLSRVPCCSLMSNVGGGRPLASNITRTTQVTNFG